MVRVKRKAIEIADTVIKPGERCSIDIDLPSSYTHSSVNMPVHVVHGRRDGPVLLVCATIHGDEINGTEIVRRLLAHKALNRLRGTLIAIPVVNVFGFVYKSRYLPDRRDLNRSFPGSENGSMASRLANVLMREIVSHCSHVIDLHTGAVGRENLPQIRANVSGNPAVEQLARAFGVPVILDARVLEGSFREAAQKLKIPVLLYEAGEALRFDEMSIRAGLRGVLNVMTALGMRALKPRKRASKSMIANTSHWVRAPQSGILRALIGTGALVKKGDLLAYVNDPLGENVGEIKSPWEGIVIGKTNLPLVYAGEAIFNVAAYEAPDRVWGHIEAYQEELAPDSETTDDGEPPVV